tara:strand:- start:1501 stop:1854 length:354 start_codon:yes stop_codon:yes gene_type:complete
MYPRGETVQGADRVDKFITALESGDIVDTGVRAVSEWVEDASASIAFSPIGIVVIDPGVDDINSGTQPFISRAPLAQKAKPPHAEIIPATLTPRQRRPAAPRNPNKRRIKYGFNQAS